MSTEYKVSAADIAKLREITGAGMSDCKKFLQEAMGDIPTAIELLRKNGAKISAKRQDNALNHGVAFSLVNADHTKGLALLVGCETDFVATGADLNDFTKQIAELALAADVNTVDELLALPASGGLKVADLLLDKVTALRENIKIVSLKRVSGEFVHSYVHKSGQESKIAVVVALNQKGAAVKEAAHKLALQTSGMHALVAQRSQLSAEMVERERGLITEMTLENAKGKPQDIIDKMVHGKMEKFFKDAVLMEQPYLFDDSKTVAQYLQSVSAGLQCIELVRLSLK